jgi:hypothetical protein
MSDEQTKPTPDSRPTQEPMQVLQDDYGYIELYKRVIAIGTGRSIWAPPVKEN